MLRPALLKGIDFRGLSGLQSPAAEGHNASWTFKEGLTLGYVRVAWAPAHAPALGWLQTRRGGCRMSESDNHHGHAAPAPFTKHWHGQLIELRDFIATHGRYPASRGTAPREAALYVWLTAQRSAFVSLTLGFEKARAMSILGDWVTPDRELEWEHRWWERLAQVQEFVAEYGRHPKYRHIAPGPERILGVWVATQRHDLLNGKISAERVSGLDEAVPWWRGK